MRRFLALLAVLLIPTHALAAVKQPAGKKDAPIEINADALEVFQEQGRAVFTGNVTAVQADMRLKSDKMTVYYRKSGEKTAPASGGMPGQGAVSRIDVDGNVFLSTPQETASGETGVYDVDKKEIKLNRNITLTRGQNVLKGDALTYNLTSGHSVVTGGAGQANKPGKERVRALFVPEKKEKQ